MIVCWLNISDLEESVADHETRLMAAEENIQGKNHLFNIQCFRKFLDRAGMKSHSLLYYNIVINLQNVLLSGLQMTDIELDERVTALEENGGACNSQNGRN